MPPPQLSPCQSAHRAVGGRRHSRSVASPHSGAPAPCSCRLLPNLRGLLFPRHLDHARDENTRRYDALRIERAQLDGLVDLRDGALRRARHGRPEVSRTLSVDEVAPAVAALRLDQGDVAVQCVLEHVAPSIDHPRFLAFREIGAVAGGGVEGADAGARGAHALRERPLRHELQLDLARAVEALEDVAVGQARVRAHDFAYAPGLEQGCDADFAVAGIVVDDGQVLRPLRDQRVDQLFGNAGAAESADEDRRAVAHVGERGFDRGYDLVDHAGAQSAFAPESFTAFAHLGISSRMKPANSAGLLRLWVRPFCESLSFTSGNSTTRLISPFRRLTTSALVPAGRKNPIQVRSSKSLKPCSFTVGTSGSAAERCALVTAMGRSFPALICGTAGGMEVLEICVCPATAAVTACAGW